MEGLGAESGTIPQVSCVYISSGWDSVFNFLYFLKFLKSSYN